MGTTILKPDPNEDFYVVWSSISESPIAFGTREEVKADLIADAVQQATAEAEARMTRADSHGTSSRVFKDEDVFIYQQQGILRKSQLKELCLRLDGNKDADVSDMLEPFEDDEG